MLKIAIFIFVITSIPAIAGVKELSWRLVEGNTVVAQSRADQVKAKTVLDKFLGGYDWNLYSTYKNEDSYLGQLFAFMVQQTKSQSIEYGLNKKLNFGADLGIAQRIVQYDLSNWTGNNATLLPSTKPYEVRHILSYKQELLQDWWGESYQFEKKIQDFNISLAKLNLDFQTENQLFNMFILYVNAKYQQTLLELNQEALRRAEKRESFVKQRVRDGLGLIVESYQAEMAKIRQQEQIEQNRQKLIQAQDDLNDLMSFNINQKEVISYSIDEKKNYSESSIDVNTNQEIAIVEANVQMTKLALDKAKLALNPSLALKFSLTNNAIKKSFSDSMNDSLPGQTNRLQTIELNFSMPLERTAAEGEVESRSADLNLQRFKLEQTKKKLENGKLNLQSEELVLIANLNYVNRRLVLAKKALEEQNRLYSMGKIDLDALIRSEEELINTQMAFAAYMMNWDVVQASLHKLAGKSVSFLDQYLE